MEDIKIRRARYFSLYLIVILEKIKETTYYDTITYTSKEIKELFEKTPVTLSMFNIMINHLELDIHKNTKYNVTYTINIQNTIDRLYYIKKNRL